MRGLGEMLGGNGPLGPCQALRPGPKADGPGYPGFHGPDTTTPKNLSSIRLSKLREQSDECITFRICFLHGNESDPCSSFS